MSGVAGGRVLPDVSVCLWLSIELMFFMYSIMVNELRVRPPFTKFEQQVLRMLRAAPSQLHPNGWAFVRAFEIVMEAFGRSCLENLFFILFNVVRSPKIDKVVSRHK